MSVYFNKSVFNSVWWIPLVLVLAVWFYVSSGFFLNDFANYYYGAYALAEGVDGCSLYDAKVFNDYLERSGFTELFVSYYPNTPFISTFFTSFLIFDGHTAKLLFNLISIGLFIYTIFRFKQRFSIPSWILFSLPLLFYMPLKTNVVFGQVYFLLLFLIGMGYLLYIEQKYVRASCLWSVAILLKVFPILIILWLLVRRDFKMFFYLIIGLCIGFLGSILINGVDIWIYYLSEVFPLSNTGIIYDGYTARAKSFTILIKNLFSYDAMLNSNPLVDSKVLLISVSTLYKVLILAYTASFTVSNKDRGLLSFGVWILATLLLGPTSSTYSQCLLIIPLFAIVMDTYMGSTSKIIITCLMLAICNVPLHLFYDISIIPLRFPRAILLLLLFMYILISNKTRLYPIYLLIFLIVMSMPTLFKSGNTVDYPYLDTRNELPICMTRLGYQDNQVYYEYRTASGIQRQTMNREYTGIDSMAVEIRNNQIFMNDKQLTYTDDHKLDPLLLDDGRIIFLSDQNRGIGFYTIRMLSQAHMQ